MALSIETSLAADLSNSVDQDPFAEVVKAFPKVKMETVVEGVLKLIQDENRNGMEARYRERGTKLTLFYSTNIDGASP